MVLRNTIVAESSRGANCAGSSSSAITDAGHDLSFPDTTCPGHQRRSEAPQLQELRRPDQHSRARIRQRRDRPGAGNGRRAARRSTSAASSAPRAARATSAPSSSPYRRSRSPPPATAPAIRWARSCLPLTAAARVGSRARSPPARARSQTASRSTPPRPPPSPSPSPPPTRPATRPQRPSATRSRPSHTTFSDQIERSPSGSSPDRATDRQAVMPARKTRSGRSRACDASTPSTLARCSRDLTPPMASARQPGDPPGSSLARADVHVGTARAPCTATEPTPDNRLAQSRETSRPDRGLRNARDGQGLPLSCDVDTLLHRHAAVSIRLLLFAESGSRASATA